MTLLKKFEIRKNNDDKSLNLNIVVGDGENHNLPLNTSSDDKIKAIRLCIEDGKVLIKKDVEPIPESNIYFRFVYEGDEILIREMEITQEKMDTEKGPVVVHVARVIGEEDYRNMVYDGLQGVGFIIDKSDVSFHQEVVNGIPCLIVKGNI